MSSISMEWLGGPIVLKLTPGRDHAGSRWGLDGGRPLLGRCRRRRRLMASVNGPAAMRATWLKTQFTGRFSTRLARSPHGPALVHPVATSRR